MIADILTRAANRLEQQGAGTQLALAKDANGVQVPPRTQNEVVAAFRKAAQEA